MNNHEHGAGIVTDMPDLTGHTLRDIVAADLGEHVTAATGQAALPRTNLGSSGPPGRAD